MQAVTLAGATADKLLLVCLQRRADDEDPRLRGSLWEVGTVATIVRRVSLADGRLKVWVQAVSYTHLRAHETVLDLVCRLLLEKKKRKKKKKKKKKNNHMSS